MKLEITYMSGAGNLFTVIDNRHYNFDFNKLSELAIKLCNLEFKTEGFLVLNSSERTDFDVLFFNPDGSSDMMCGNGGRCAIFYADINRFFEKKENVSFEMANEKYKGTILPDKLSLHLPPPKSFKFIETIQIDEFEYTYHYVDVGSKHFVINFDDVFSSDFEQTNIDEFAKKIRWNDKFAPEGVNVNIFKLYENNSIKLKTFEKGVERVTGACGTGAISSSLTVINNYQYNNPVKVIPPSGIPLEVEFLYKDKQISEIILSGHAEIINKIIVDV